MTAQALQGILLELKARELLLHRPVSATTRRDVENMMEPDCWEVAASGRVYDRKSMLDEVERRFANPDEERWETNDFRCQEIATDNYLLTYWLAQKNRVTRRATIWRRTAGGWKIFYHQGTIIQDG